MCCVDFWMHCILKAVSHECRIGQRMKNEWCLTHEKWMMLTKEKNDLHKQHKLPNDERPVKGLNEMHFRRIWKNARKCHWFLMHWPVRHLCDRVLTERKFRYSDVIWLSSFILHIKEELHVIWVTICSLRPLSQSHSEAIAHERHILTTSIANQR